MARISEKTRQKLLDKFETMDILEAVEALDQIRHIMADGDEIKPPQVRDDLLNLHSILHKVVNEGHDMSEDEDIWKLASEIEDTLYPLLENAEKIVNVLQKLMDLDPDNDDADDDDEDEDIYEDDDDDF